MLLNICLNWFRASVSASWTSFKILGKALQDDYCAQIQALATEVGALSATTRSSPDHQESAAPALVSNTPLPALVGASPPLPSGVAPVVQEMTCADPLHDNGPLTVAHGSPGDPAESIVSPLPFGDPVRLDGLKTISFNERFGFMTGFVEKSGRYGVRLHGEVETRVFLYQNFKRYEHDPDDMCPFCLDIVNLRSFPPCTCDSKPNI